MLTSTGSKSASILARSIRGVIPAVALIAAGSVLLPLGSAKADSQTWVGNTDSTWANPANWSLGVGSNVPGTGDIATFDYTGQAGTIDLSGGVAINIINFDNNPGSYIIGAGGAGVQNLTLDDGGAITMTSAVYNDQTINANIILNNSGPTHNFSFNNNSGNALNVAGGISGSGNVIVNAGGAVLLNGNNAYTGGLTKTGTGTLTLAQVQNYTGATLISAGTVQLGAVYSAPSSPPVAGYSYWFNAANLGLGNGTAVTSWTNGGSVGGSATDVTGGANSPTYDANAINGHGAVLLNGQQALLWSQEDSHIQTVFSVFKGTSFLMSDSANPGSGQYNFHRFNGDDTDANAPLWDGPSAHGWTSSNITSGKTTVNGVVADYSQTNMPTNLNNGFNLIAVQATGPVTADSFNYDRGSGGNSWVHYAQGEGQEQGEVIVYDSQLTDAQVLQVEAYLNAEWGLGIAGLAVSSTPDNILPVTTALTISNGGILNLNGGNQQIASIAGAGLIVNGGANAVLTINPSSGSTTFSGSITDGSGQISLVKIGAGTQVLSGSNSYSGGTTISAGLLQIGSANALSPNGPVIVTGGTLDLGGYTFTTSSTVSFQGGLTQNGTIINNGDPNTGYDGQAGTVTASLQGSAGLTKTTTGTLTLSGPTSYTGATTVVAGTLDLGGNTLTTNVGVSIQGGVTQNGVFVNNGAAYDAQQGVVTASLQGTAGLNKTTSGTIDLGGTATSSTPTFSGNTAINAGTINLSNGFVLQNSTVSLAGGGLTFSSGVTSVALGGIGGSGNLALTTAAAEPVALTVGSNNAATIYAGVLSGGSSFTKVGTGTTTLMGYNTYGGPTAINGGVLQLSAPSSQQILSMTGWTQDLIIGKNESAPTTTANLAGWDFYEAGYGSSIQGLPADSGATPRTFTSSYNPSVKFQFAPYAGNNALTLNGSSGALSLATPGKFTSIQILDEAQGGGGGATWSATLNFADGSTLNTSTFVDDDWTQGDNPNTCITNFGLLNTDGVTYYNNFLYMAEHDITLPTAYQSKVLDSITFSDTNNNLAVFAISGSEVQLPGSVSNILPTGTPITIATNATLDLNGISQQVPSITGTGSVTNSNAGTLSTLTIALAGGTSTFDGTISESLGSGQVGLVKSGAGTLVLTGASAYSGGTSVSGGTLVVSGSIGSGAIGAANTTIFSVADNTSATLSGLGTVNGNVVVTTPTGTGRVNQIVPGTIDGVSVGTLNVGGLYLQAGSTAYFKTLATAGSSDFINVSGVLAADLGAVIDVPDSILTGSLASYNLIGFGSTTASIDNFVLADQNGNPVSANDYLTYVGNTLELVVSDHPNSYTWNGAATPNNNWMTAGNWNQLPTSGSVLIFAGSTNVNTNNDFVGETFGGLKFAANAGSFTLAGNDVTLAGYISNLSSSAQTQSISLNIALAQTAPINTGTGNLVISGKFSDATTSAGLTIEGTTGTVTLTGVNTQTGVVTLAGGTLNVASIGNGGNTNGNLGAAGNAAANLVFSGGTLQYTGSGESTDRSFTITPGSNAGVVVANPSANLILAGTTPATTGGLALTGPGTVTLKGANYGYTGTTTVTGGTLSIGDGTGALPTLATSGITLAGNANVIFNHTDSTSFTKAVSGSGSFQKAGSGTLTLTQAQGYTGTTLISGGTLQIGATIAAPSGTGFGVFNHVAEAQNYTLDYQLNITNSNNYSGGSPGYSVNNSAAIPNGSFNRVGYYMELQTPSSQLYFMYVSFDAGAFSTQANKLGVPNTASGEFYHFGGTGGQIQNMNIVTNIPGISGLSYSGGLGKANGLSSGVAQFWPSNYGNGNTYNVPGQTPGVWGVGDDSASTNPGYGSMKIGSDGMGGGPNGILFAFNNWNSGGGEVGIGDGSTVNNIFPELSNANSDYTFSGYLSQYTVKNLQVVVGGAGSAGVNILPVTTDLSITSGAALDLGGTNQQIASLTGGGNVTNSNAASDSVLTIAPTGGTTTFGGSINDGNGKIGLVKTGAGTEVLTGSNNYSGGTTVSGGTLQIGSANSLPTSGAITVTGGTLDLGGFTPTTTAPVSFQGGTTQNGTIINNGANYDARAGTVTASLQGSAGLDKTTGGILNLGAANTYAGDTNVIAGTINVANAGALQNSTVNLTGGGVAFSTGVTNPVFGGLKGGGNVALATATAEPVNLTAGTNGASTTYAGSLSGAGGLTKSGGGTLTLTAAQAYNGATVVSGGVLQLAAAPPLPTVSGTLQYELDASNPASVGNSPSVTSWNDLSGNGRNFATNGNGAPTLVPNDFGNLPGVHFDGSSTGLSYNGTVTAQTVFIVNRDGGGGGIGGIWGLKGGDNGIRIANTGNWSGSPDGAGDGNDYTNTGGGTTFITTASSSDVNTTNFTQGATQILCAYGNQTYSATGLGQYFYGGRYWSGDIGEVLVYDTQLSSTDRQTIENYLAAKWITGAGAGAGSNVLPITTALSVSAGATLDLGGVNQQLASIQGAATSYIINSNASTPVVLTLSAAGGSTTFAGTISETSGGGVGQISVAMQGSGTQILSGANTYSGGTVITGGTLLVNNTTGSGTGTGPVSVGNGGNLGSNGTVGGNGNISGSVTINYGGIISPGAGGTPSTLTTAGQTWNAGGEYVINTTLSTGHGITNTGNTSNPNYTSAPIKASDVMAAAGTQDFLLVSGVNGTIQLNSTPATPFILDIVSSAGLTGQTAFIVASASEILDSSSTPYVLGPNGYDVTNLFAVDDNGQPAASGTYDVSIQSDQDGNMDIVVTPEPGSVGLLGVAAVGLLRRRRRNPAG